jgi:hypothetical protein
MTADDDPTLPAVTHVFDSVKRGLLCLGTALNPKSETSGMMYRAGVSKTFKKEATADKHEPGSPSRMPGAYPAVSGTGEQESLLIRCTN